MVVETQEYQLWNALLVGTTEHSPPLGYSFDDVLEERIAKEKCQQDDQDRLEARSTPWWEECAERSRAGADRVRMEEWFDMYGLLRGATSLLPMRLKLKVNAVSMLFHALDFSISTCLMLPSANLPQTNRLKLTMRKIGATTSDAQGRVDVRQARLFYASYLSMLLGWPCRSRILRVSACRDPIFLGHLRPQRCFTWVPHRQQHEDIQTSTNRTRNIGIIAHIDAGKTTTTERMLYYSGHTRRIGNVDDGSTVTDFLPAERARGVTIQSAAITFHWPPLPETSKVEAKTQKGGTPLLSPSTTEHHLINLIDTPGHADFTFEVVRSLRILDGAVCILDGVAGVEAQTEKVWYQAAKYKIPKIIYVNKLDRDGAAFGRTVQEIASRLYTWPAVCQIPWFEGGKGRFCGIGDVISLRAYRWQEGGDGKIVEATYIDNLQNFEPAFVAEVRKARIALVELLTDYDDILVARFLEVKEKHHDISSEDIVASLRRCVLDRDSKIVAVFAGASFRNIGVQPLLDAIVQLLPSPEEVPNPEVSVGRAEGTLSQLLSGELLSKEFQTAPSRTKRGKGIVQRGPMAVISNLEACALAFKVVHDPRRGALVYVRVYSGRIRRGASLYNTNLQVTEPAQRLLRMYAQDSVDVSFLPAGQIGVIPGLKHTRTGDTLISYIGASEKTGPPPPLNSLQLRPIEVPPAVFFSSVESHSLGEQKGVKNALDLLIREDPSLQLSVDEESGQTLLSGMGEFHLEIAADRLTKDLKAKAAMGKIEIAYREALLFPSEPQTITIDREIVGKKAKAGCTATVEPLIEDEHEDSMLDDCDATTVEAGNRISTSISTPEDPSGKIRSWNRKLPSHLTSETLRVALTNGALAALVRGINYPFPYHNVHVTITIDPRTQIFGTDSHPAALATAAREATKSALRHAAKGGTAVLEHVMNVTVSTDEASLGAVVKDLSSERGGHVISLDDADATTSSIREDLPVIDLRKVYAPRDPFEGGTTFADQEQAVMNNSSRHRTIKARVPLREMMGYLKHLRSITGGRGSFVMSADRFERVVGRRERILQKELGAY